MTEPCNTSCNTNLGFVLQNVVIIVVQASWLFAAAGGDEGKGMNGLPLIRRPRMNVNHFLATKCKPV